MNNYPAKFDVSKEIGGRVTGPELIKVTLHVPGKPPGKPTRKTRPRKTHAVLKIGGRVTGPEKELNADDVVEIVAMWRQSPFRGGVVKTQTRGFGFSVRASMAQPGLSGAGRYTCPEQQRSNRMVR